MLGEIVKTTDALRYHAKAAETSGRNLAHVNDENYARQRILLREGSMHSEFGGLNTSSLGHSGLEQARNPLLDKRLLGEFGESSALDAQKEILVLLQAALGERVDSQGIYGGLDDSHDSNLAAGGLARALDDFFDAFHELSASPDEATAKQEIFNKIQTLSKRFNDAGTSLDEIDSDLSANVERSVDSVNRLLDQIHEVNLQIKRFELLDRGAAVSYRDRRQGLLEDLSKLIDFKIEPEIDGETGRETGFWEISSIDKDGQSVKLVSVDKEPVNITKDFGNIVTLENEEGKGAKIRAKIDSSGSLGFVEVLDGGSQYSDSLGPVLVAFGPPIVNDDAGQGKSISNYEDGEIFSQGGEFYQSIGRTLAGSELQDENMFLKISELPQSGKVFEETVRRYSHLETFENNDQIYYEGKLYQATESVGPTGVLEFEPSRELTKEYELGAVIQYGDNYYQLDKAIQGGSRIPANLLRTGGEPGESIDGFRLLAADDPAVANAEVAQLSDSQVVAREYSKGEVLKYGDTFFQVWKKIEADSELVGFGEGEVTLGQEFGGLVAIGSVPPLKVNDLNYFTTTSGDEERWFLNNSYEAGDVVKFENTFFEFNQSAYRDLEVPELRAFLQSGVEGQVGAVFDGVATLIENPNPDFDLQNAGEYLTLSNGEPMLVNAMTERAQSIDEFKKTEVPMRFKRNEVYYYQNQGDEGGVTHFIVTAPPEDIDPSEFNPADSQWNQYFKVFKPQLLNDGDPSVIVRKTYPTGHNLTNGSLVEINIGLAEAVINDGEIKGFNVVNSGNSLSSTDAVFVDGKELDVQGGVIKGYQDARVLHLEKFRTDLNDLVSSFVEEINELYNPTDVPGSYLFGFDAVLTRPVVGKNALMEEEYGYFGREGDALIKLYREEVDMMLPIAESEEFTIVNTTPVFPEDFEGVVPYFRGGDEAETLFRSDESGDFYSFYASARRMQNVTMENDVTYPGEDLLTGTEDDGRSLMMAYETIPFRLEGLEDGAKLPIIGDNFTFLALPANTWNLASSLRIDKSLSVDTLLATHSDTLGANEVARKIAEMGTDGTYTDKVAMINSDLGTNISDISDNLEHQKSVETFLLDQRRSISSVSIDEEVADLMRFQRSFQASSRVLNTLDKMLELVVMGLLK
jgi:flagellar hook-associated protein FlgK